MEVWDMMQNQYKAPKIIVKYFFRFLEMHPCGQ
jgi:hypothetical protein